MPPKGSRQRRENTRTSASGSHGVNTLFDQQRYRQGAGSGQGPRRSNGFRINSSGSGASTFSAANSAGSNNEDGSHGSSLPSTLVQLRERILEERGGVSGADGHLRRVLAFAFGSGSVERARSSSGRPRRKSDDKSDRASQRESLPSSMDAGNDDIEVEAVEFSLICPYSRVRMMTPVRSKDCSHVQCCDLDSWLVMLDKYRSMRDPMAPCPVCEQRVSASSLEVDEWVATVLEKMPAATRLVLVDADGSVRSGDASRRAKREKIEEFVVVDATQQGTMLTPPSQESCEDTFHRADTYGESPVPRVRVKREREETEGNTYNIDRPNRTNDRVLGDDGNADRSNPISHLSEPPPLHTQPSQVIPAPQEMQRTTAAIAINNSPPLLDEHDESNIVANGSTTSTVRGNNEAPAHGAQGKHLSAFDSSNNNNNNTGSAGSADEDVVMVQFELPSQSSMSTQNGAGGGCGVVQHALPSQLRMWSAYCVKCARQCVKNEDGLSGCPVCSDMPEESCEQTLVRTIPSSLPNSQPVSMELLADGTLLMCGVDELTPFLVRGGFYRSPYAVERASTPTFQYFHGQNKNQTTPKSRGVWYSSAPLTRFDLDFLEACCVRVAAGESAEDIPLIPFGFRYKKQTRRNGNSNYEPHEGFVNTSQSQRNWSGGGGGGGGGGYGNSWTSV